MPRLGLLVAALIVTALVALAPGRADAQAGLEVHGPARGQAAQSDGRYVVWESAEEPGIVVLDTATAGRRLVAEQERCPLRHVGGGRMLLGCQTEADPVTGWLVDLRTLRRTPLRPRTEDGRRLFPHMVGRRWVRLWRGLGAPQDRPTLARRIGSSRTVALPALRARDLIDLDARDPRRRLCAPVRRPALPGSGGPGAVGVGRGIVAWADTRDGAVRVQRCGDRAARKVGDCGTCGTVGVGGTVVAWAAERGAASETPQPALETWSARAGRRTWEIDAPFPPSEGPVIAGGRAYAVFGGNVVSVPAA